MIKVSVVIPAYNSAEFLASCIESVLTQTERSLQVIVVNDGSTDETLKIAQYCAEKDSRIVVVDQPNSGVSKARNRGMKEAVGEYLCFMDSDDWAEPTMIECMLQISKATGADIVGAGVSIDYLDKNERRIYSSVQRHPEWILSDDDPLPPHFATEAFINLLGFTWNKLYRTALIKKLDLQFDPQLSLYEDVDFNVRYFTNSNRVAFSPKVFVHYNQRPQDSLVSARDTDFFDVSYRAISNIDYLLEHWQINESFRNQRKARASVGALSAALSGAPAKRYPGRFLKELAGSAKANDLLEAALGAEGLNLRHRVAILTFQGGWYQLGVLFAYVIQPARRYKSYIFRLLHQSSFQLKCCGNKRLLR